MNRACFKSSGSYGYRSFLPQTIVNNVAERGTARRQQTNGGRAMSGGEDETNLRLPSGTQ